MDRNEDRMSDQVSHAVEVLMGDPALRLVDLLPGLQVLPQERIASPHIDTRCRTTLGRLGCKVWAELAYLSAGELRQVPGSGELTVVRILTAAATRHFEVAALGDAVGATERTGPDSVGSSAEDLGGLVQLHDLLTQMARWAVRERGASRLVDLLALSPDLGRVPPEVADEFARLARLELTTFVRPEDIELPPSLLRRLVESERVRMDVLLRRKVARAQRPTLAELGDELGVTRERVRQLEAKALDEVMERLRSAEFAPLRWRASDLAEVLGPAVPLSDESLTSALEWATRGLEEPADVSAGDLMLWVAGPYAEDDGWLVRSGSSLAELTTRVDALLGNEVVVDEDDVRRALDVVGIEQHLLYSVMATVKSWRELAEGTWIRWRGSVVDKAEVVLRLVGEPLLAEEINAHIGEGHSDRGLRGRLLGDDRFTRLDRPGRFGMRDWGLEEYSGIADEITQRIERAGGVPVPLVDLVREFVVEFGVSESSVIAYAKSPAFVLEDDRVRLRRPDEPFEVEVSVADCRGLFALPEVVTFAIEVDSEVLRGSGQGAPVALAAALGVGPGDRRTFSGDGGGTVVSWPPTSAAGPSLGSVLDLVKSAGLAEHDRGILRFWLESERVELLPFDLADLESATGLPDLEEPERTVARALGVRRMAVGAALRDRGDNEIAAFFSQPELDEQLRAAVESLGDLLGE